MRLDKLIIMQTLSQMLEGSYEFPYTDLNGDHVLRFDATVSRGRKTVSAQQDVPYSISILEVPRATAGIPSDLDNRQSYEQWTLNVQGWPPEDRLNPSDPAYVMAAAVRERMGRLVARNAETGEPDFPAEYMFGSRVASITFGSTVVTPPAEGVSAVAWWYMPVIVSLVQQTGKR